MYLFSLPIKYNNFPFLPGLLKGLKQDNSYKYIHILATKEVKHVAIVPMISFETETEGDL